MSAVKSRIKNEVISRLDRYLESTETDKLIKDGHCVPVWLVCLQLFDLLEDGRSYLDLNIGVRNGHISNVHAQNQKVNPNDQSGPYHDMLEQMLKLK
jgi:hypothetical protein